MENVEVIIVLLVTALAATLGARTLLRRIPLVLRQIPAFDVLPAAAADAVESSYRLHFALGSSGLGFGGSLSTLVSAEVIYRLAQRLAVSRQSPLITLNDALTLPLAQDTLRRAYEYRQTMEYYRAHAAAWFPQGQRSLAFAAGAASLSADLDAVGNVLLGRFGTELAFLGESAMRHDQTLIAHSDLIEGQAIAFAQADQVLLGEELYAGPAYMNPRKVDEGSLLATELLRWLVIFGILVTALEAAL
ncbi:MAG: hypothetical protein GYB65_08490 [Chloroflexi bacterium]|nr:hypothetical protein [Chloroflexota bacterium]